MAAIKLSIAGNGSLIFPVIKPHLSATAIFTGIIRPEKKFINSFSNHKVRLCFFARLSFRLAMPFLISPMLSTLKYKDFAGTVFRNSLTELSGFFFFLLEFSPDVRAKEGIFLAFQYPIEVPGVSNFNFLHTSFNSVLQHQGAEPLSEGDFREFLHKKMQIVNMKPEYLDRAVNVGFSGGEKKRNEILQMAVLSPRLALLDETDSGLDIDALRIVAEGVNKLRTKENAVILVTHYQRLLDYIKPDFVHVLSNGKIIQTGDASLALELEKKGYDWLT